MWLKGPCVLEARSHEVIGIPTGKDQPPCQQEARAHSQWCEGFMRDILKDGAESRQEIKDSEALQEPLPSPGLRGGKEWLVN